MKHRISSVAAILPLLLVAARASADPSKASPSAPSAAEKPADPERARALLVRRGKGLVQEGSYADALEAFGGALEIRSDPKVLLWRGYVEEQMGKLLTAKATYLEARSAAQASKLLRDQ